MLDSDLCIIDGKDFYVRGCLDLPIKDRSECFDWSVWVSVSRASLNRIVELWDADIRNNEPPFFGWLCNELAPYSGSFSLKANLHLRNSGLRPLIVLEPTDHPLAREQRFGISLRQIEEIAAALLSHQ